MEDDVGGDLRCHRGDDACYGPDGPAEILCSARIDHNLVDGLHHHERLPGAGKNPRGGAGVGADVADPAARAQTRIDHRRLPLHPPAGRDVAGHPLGLDDELPGRAFTIGSGIPPVGRLQREPSGAIAVADRAHDLRLDIRRVHPVHRRGQRVAGLPGSGRQRRGPRDVLLRDGSCVVVNHCRRAGGLRRARGERGAARPHGGDGHREGGRPARPDGAISAATRKHHEPHKSQFSHLSHRAGRFRRHRLHCNPITRR